MELPDPLSSYVSTGSLPPSDQVARLIAEAHERFAKVELGKNSQVYPALARVPGDLFGICVVDMDGRRVDRVLIIPPKAKAAGRR